MGSKNKILFPFVLNHKEILTWRNFDASSKTMENVWWFAGEQLKSTMQHDHLQISQTGVV